MEVLLLRSVQLYLVTISVIQGSHGKFQFKKAIQNHTIIASDDSWVTLRCMFEKANSHERTWRIGDKILFVNDQKVARNDRITLRENTPEEYSIRIENVIAEDDGIYLCTVQVHIGDSEDVYTLKHNLTVNVPAYLTSDLSERERVVDEGDSFSLKCIARGKPRPQISWRHMVPPGVDVMATGDHLAFFDITREQEGLYECSADNYMGSPQIHTIQVSVRYAPVMDTHQAKKEVAAAVGQMIVLECTASSYPLATFTWEHRGTMYEQSTNRDSRVQVATAKVRKYTVRSKLNIELIREEDFGKYVCIAKNMKGQANMTIILKKAPPIVTRVPPSIAFSIGKKESRKGENAATSIHRLGMAFFIVPLLIRQLLESP